MSSFKLNLKPAHAFANARSEQNEVDAVTREAEVEERAKSASPSTSNAEDIPSLANSSSGPATNARNGAASSAVEIPPVAAAPPPFALKKLAIPPRAVEEQAPAAADSASARAAAAFDPSASSSPRRHEVNSSMDGSTSARGLRSSRSGGGGGGGHVDPTAGTTMLPSGGGGGAPSSPSQVKSSPTAPAAPSLGVPGLRLGLNLGGHQRVVSGAGDTLMTSARNSSRGSISARNHNNSIDSETAAAITHQHANNGAPLYRKGTINSLKSTQTSAAAPATGASPRPSVSSIPPVPAFSIALSKLHGSSPAGSAVRTGSIVGGGDSSSNVPTVSLLAAAQRRASLDGGCGGGGATIASARSHKEGSVVTIPPFAFARYNPEIEKEVPIDEEDDFLIEIDDFGDDTHQLKNALVNARRELLSWDVRFDAMRDHYHDSVAKLVAFMEHENIERLHQIYQQQQQISSSAYTSLHHSPAGGNTQSSPHQYTNTMRGGGAPQSHRSESSNGESPRSLGLIGSAADAGGVRRHGSIATTTHTARGYRGGVSGLMDTAVQTDITIEVLEVMIKYPQSVRGERGNTRATSPAVNATTRTSLLRKSSKSPAASPISCFRGAGTDRSSAIGEGSIRVSSGGGGAAVASPTVSVGGTGGQSSYQSRRSGAVPTVSARPSSASASASAARPLSVQQQLRASERQAAASATPITRAVLAANGHGATTTTTTRSAGRSTVANDSFTPNLSGSGIAPTPLAGQSSLHTGRHHHQHHKNSALLSVASDVAPGATTPSAASLGRSSGKLGTATTPRAGVNGTGSLMTSRGVSPSVGTQASNRLAAQRSASPQTASLQHSTFERPPIQIPAQLSTSTYIKPGSRKFAGVSATTPTAAGATTSGGDQTTRRSGKLATSRNAAAFEPTSSNSSSIHNTNTGAGGRTGLDGLKPLDFGGSLTSGGMSGYEVSNAASPNYNQTTNRAASPATTIHVGGGVAVTDAAGNPQHQFAPRQIEKRSGSTSAGSPKYPPAPEHIPSRRESTTTNTTSNNASTLQE